MTPWLDDGDVTLYHGDALDVLRELPAGSVHMCATSPPFYGLRDYGTGEWEGGEPGCDHREIHPQNREGRETPGGRGGSFPTTERAYKTVCGKCGARRVDQQIGLEETPDQWVNRLVAVFREVRRVLRDDGTLWVEIGDSYSGSSKGGAVSDEAWNRLQGDSTVPVYEGGKRPVIPRLEPGSNKVPLGTKPKDLLGAPWLLAFALRNDGWYLRSEIIWARPNPMPESVTDRPTKAHSTVFLLSKRPRYFFDADAIREAFAGEFLSSGVKNPRYGRPGGLLPHEANNRSAGARHQHEPGVKAMGFKDGAAVAYSGALYHPTLDGSAGEAPRGPDGRRVTTVKGTDASEQHRDGERWPNPTGANARSVWQIPTEPTPFAHFATWPQALVRRMILAGTSERGCCPECGAPWGRETEREVTNPGNRQNNGRYDGSIPERRGFEARREVAVSTLGWSPSCTHDREPVPCLILDPFAGSGTTSLVARNHGRHSIGIELNQSYLEIAAKRLQQLSLLASPTTEAS